MTKDECIKLLKKYMDILKDKYGITSLSLFGSTARGEQTAQSDIDLFVDTETPNPFLLMDAKEFLENATGSSIDIVRNHQNLNPRLRKRILKDGIFIFWEDVTGTSPLSPQRGNNNHTLLIDGVMISRHVPSFSTRCM